MTPSDKSSAIVLFYFLSDSVNGKILKREYSLDSSIPWIYTGVNKAHIIALHNLLQ